MDDLKHQIEISYHTFNSMLRKYGGICCSSKHNCLIMETNKTFEDLIYLYKNTNFNNKCPICDLDGNLYERAHNYLTKGKPGRKGKGILYKNIYKDIMSSNYLYTIVNDKVFTLPYLCRFVQKCISNNT